MSGLSARGPTSGVSGVGPALGVVQVDDITLNYDFPGGSSVVIGQRNINVLGPFYNPDAEATAGVQGFTTPLGYRVEPQGNISVDVFGIPPGQVGRPSLVVDVLIEPTGIASEEAVGSPDVSVTGLIQPNGIASEEAVGVPTIHRTDYIDVSGIASEEAVGTPTVVSEGLISPTGIASEEAVGTPDLVIDQILRPSGISPGEVGVPSIKKKFPNTERFFEQLGEVYVPGEGTNSAYLIEAFGGSIAEYTSFEPDVATFRGEYYYNTRLNVLFKKMGSRNPDSNEVSYRWVKISGF